MTNLLLIILAIIFIVLTVWLLLVPVGIVAGTVKAVRQTGWRGGRRMHRPH